MEEQSAGKREVGVLNPVESTKVAVLAVNFLGTWWLTRPMSDTVKKPLNEILPGRMVKPLDSY